MPKSSESIAIECRSVTKRYHHYEHRRRTLQEFVLDRFRPGGRVRASGAFELEPFDVRIDRGESFALIGPNGGGKSTVLRLMAGIYPPTTGTVVRHGRLVAVIELGTTFQPELTGEENVDLYAAALGVRRRELSERRERIFEFSGVAEFRDLPLKYYSSGMRSRLAFSIATHAEPETLLLDEVLAVGDLAFRSKCYERLQRFNAEGGTLVVVTHDLDSARDLCRRGVWLEHGRVRADGPIDAVIAAYEAEQE